MIPTPNSISSQHQGYFYSEEKINGVSNNYIEIDNIECENYSQISFNKNDEILLLPTDPVDKSIPPCTTEQLTPILPVDLENSKMNSSYFNIDIKSNIDSLEKPPIPVSNLSSTTTNTVNSSSTENSNTTRRTSISLNSSPIRISFSNIQKNYPSSSTSDYNLHEIIQHDVNNIFTKSNQIDHLDKDLDIKKNDQLADQMALNILQNITEENVDELSKLKEEISMKFQ
ncbi:hypothetical protein C6P40_004722 [Pichia californica]|uniref:Uncharacterized protein n=1 Tax=Pichia californica TaxID=460514 RepID=A0A9P6WI94_9ASCO|nr:hypothetical protein C6P40_004722 [[Candida] californica]